VLSHEVNDVLRVLTAASALLLPMTLIASIFGMNVRVPGQDEVSGFWVVIAVMVVLAAGLVYLFRRRRWL
jgi:magnesium transporter